MTHNTAAKQLGTRTGTQDNAGAGARVREKQDGSRINKGLPWWLSGIHLLLQETQASRVQPLGWEDPLEKGMAALSSILAWAHGRRSLAG